MGSLIRFGQINPTFGPLRDGIDQPGTLTSVGTLVNSSWLRTSGYLLAATAALIAGRKELRSRSVGSDSWPLFWFLAAGILLAMALTRGTDFAHLLPELGRRSAYSGGWYDQRRRLQAAVIVVLGAALIGAVAVALGWIPKNRRHYLPEATIVFALAGFAGVRLVSLHQVDVLLYNRRIEGVKVDAVIELTILAAAIVVPFRKFPASDPLTRFRVGRSGRSSAEVDE